MSCSDRCISMDYDEGNAFYTESTPRARKGYVCCECGGAIAIGDEYELSRGKTCGGDFFVARTCAVCAEIRHAFCCSWVFGELWDSIHSELFRGWNEMTAIDCLAKLSTQAAVAKMRAKYAESREVNGE